MYNKKMKHLFALFLLSICWVSGQADPLPTNQEDKPKGTETIVYSRFRAFNMPKPDENSAYVLGEFTYSNEWTNYFIRENNLYFAWSGTPYFHLIPAEPLPILESFQIWQDNYEEFEKQFLAEFAVPHLDGKNFSLPCGKNSSVEFIKQIKKGAPGEENDVFYQIIWHKDGKQHTFARKECPVPVIDFPPGQFAYCDKNILYYDGFDDFPWPGRNKARRGIFFCDLQNHTRGAYAATPYETKEKSALYPYNPIGIPGTNWIFYLQDSDESPRKSQLVVRPKLTPTQAEKAVKEYQTFIQKNTKK